MNVAGQLIRHFQVENVSPGKTEIMLNISDTIELTFIKFSPNDRTVAGHLILVTDYFENVGQCRNFQKCVILKNEFVFKKYTKSNLAGGNR